jgi:hypothetical protein
MKNKKNVFMPGISRKNVIVEPIPEGALPVFEVNVIDDLKVWVADVQDFVPLEQALAKINEEWVENNNSILTILDLAKACKALLNMKKPGICQHAVPHEYTCLKDNSVCKGQCGIQTDQAVN